MTKAEFVSEVAKKAGTSAKVVDAVIMAFAEVITEVVKKDDKVSLPRFGTFSASKRAAREGKNPRTNEKIVIPASTSVHFATSSALKKQVNQ